jgi:hypothetical protein
MAQEIANGDRKRPKRSSATLCRLGLGLGLGLGDAWVTPGTPKRHAWVTPGSRKGRIEQVLCFECG